jgi:hypothetical protein
MGKNVGVLPLQQSEFFSGFPTILTGALPLNDARLEGLDLVLVSIETQNEVRIHWSVDI